MQSLRSKEIKYDYGHVDKGNLGVQVELWLKKSPHRDKKQIDDSARYYKYRLIKVQPFDFFDLSDMRKRGCAEWISYNN